MTTPNLDPAAIAAAVQAYLAQQAPPAPVPADERPAPHLFDVLKHLVSVAPLASQGVIQEYHAVLDAAREAWDELLGKGAPASEPVKANNE